jgi:hypothetical protein
LIRGGATAGSLRRRAISTNGKFRAKALLCPSDITEDPGIEFSTRTVLPDRAG